MPEDIEDFRRWMELPQTNQSAFEALMAECMADADQRAVMTVLNVVLREIEQ